MLLLLLLLLLLRVVVGSGGQEQGCSRVEVGNETLKLTPPAVLLLLCIFFALAFLPSCLLFLPVLHVIRSAIRSFTSEGMKTTRSLFGKKIESPNDLFQAMDRDGDGILAYDEVRGGASLFFCCC